MQKELGKCTKDFWFCDNFCEGAKIVGGDTIAVKLFFILPLPTSLSSIIDDWQGKIKRFSLGKCLVEDKKDVANGKNWKSA